jgi:hypothetical protein
MAILNFKTTPKFVVVRDFDFYPKFAQFWAACTSIFAAMITEPRRTALAAMPNGAQQRGCETGQ